MPKGRLKEFTKVDSRELDSGAGCDPACFNFLTSYPCYLDKNRKLIFRDFPGGPVVKTPHFHCEGHRFDDWLGIPHAVLRSCMPRNVAKK